MAVNLTNALLPKDLTGEDWYTEATGILEQYAKEDRAASEKERAAKEEKEKEVLQKIKEQTKPIDAIMQEGDDNVTKIRKLLVHIYKAHQPRCKTHRLGEMKPDMLRKTLVKAIMHYHVDKQQRYCPRKTTEKETQRVEGSVESDDAGNTEGDGEEEEGVESNGHANDNNIFADMESFTKWEVLCGVIVRHLNFLYEHTYKGDLTSS
ncbi:unnamed protein product [Choristocarpus tenellus]